MSLYQDFALSQISRKTTQDVGLKTLKAHVDKTLAGDLKIQGEGAQVALETMPQRLELLDLNQQS